MYIHIYIYTYTHYRLCIYIYIYIYEALTIGVVNVVGSSIARMTDAGVYLHAGVLSYY